MTNMNRMNKIINKLSDEPFEFGKNDCFTFTNSLVKEWHGKDFLAAHIHRYEDEKTAQKYIEAFGGIERLITGTIGYPHKYVGLAQNGDVVTAEVGPGEIGIGFVYEGKAFFKGKKKVLQMKLNKCRMAWSIK